MTDSPDNESRYNNKSNRIDLDENGNNGVSYTENNDVKATPFNDKYGLKNILNIDLTWGPLVASLHPDRDVILFPAEGAILAEDFAWNGPNRVKLNEMDEVLESRTSSRDGIGSVETSVILESSSSVNNTIDDGRKTLSENDDPSKRNKWRLVVLEASWGHGKTIFHQLTAYRKYLNLPPLPCVVLSDLVKGEYWRFHEEGHSAVSTIEAIAHTAFAAGLPLNKYEDLLILFKLQKYRVLNRVLEGGKAPKAVVVSGEGLGSWTALTGALTELT